jgi:hypothetical protein
MGVVNTNDSLLKDGKAIVLCLNDYPIGVYLTSEEADAAAKLDWERREKPYVPWKPKGMKLGQAWDGGGLYMKYYYYQRTFIVGAEAAL